MNEKFMKKLSKNAWLSKKRLIQWISNLRKESNKIWSLKT